ncbi:MAG: hypothetical protein HZB68_04075 [Candidatus Aenigmarchaeota archaeon]|nr:hypothetical protein [Candidatus Aenigmarchaeota archaeon]
MGNIIFEDNETEKFYAQMEKELMGFVKDVSKRRETCREVMEGNYPKKVKEDTARFYGLT